MQPFQRKQQQQQQCQRQHWQHQHNRQHSSSSDNTRPLHIDGDRQLARNSRGARFFFCRVLWKWQFQISRTFICPSVLPSRSVPPVWLVWPVTNKSWKLAKYCIMSDLFQLFYDNLSGLVLKLVWLYDCQWLECGLLLFKWLEIISYPFISWLFLERFSWTIYGKIWIPLKSSNQNKTFLSAKQLSCFL